MSERALHPEQRQNHKLESDARGDSRDHENTTVHRQSTRSESEDVKNESFKKVKSDDRKKFFYCNKTGHMRAECRQRLKDLAEAEGKPVAASPHPHDATAIVPLLPGERHSSTFVIAMPCVNNETSCEFSSEQTVRSSSEQTVRSPGAGSFAPAETQRARPIAADSVK